MVPIKNNEYMIYTPELLESELSKLDNFLALAPGIFQKKISKKSELRITVVGEQVFAARLILKSKKALKEDIHLSEYGVDMDIESFELTADDKNRMVGLMKAFGLEYGSVDFIFVSLFKQIFMKNSAKDRNIDKLFEIWLNLIIQFLEIDTQEET
jgi:hypothetical protein